MTPFNTKHLYRYILKRGKSYTIRKNNKHYGSFVKLENAMLERDLLEDVDWNVNALINLPTVVNNRYFEWDLPPFPVRRMGEGLPKYIVRGDGRYRVQKLIDGKVYSFGSYKSLSEAVSVRDELMSKGWSKSKADWKSEVLI